MPKQPTFRDAETEAAAGYAGFMLAKSILAALVERKIITAQMAELLVLDVASNFAGDGRLERATQQLLLDLVGSHSQNESPRLIARAQKT
jgi:hypothetical protein